MWVFIVFYGLDWVATVPPTVALCRMHFGIADSGVVFGWVFASHMVGAGVGASVAGWVRHEPGRLPLGLGRGGGPVLRLGGDHAVDPEDAGARRRSDTGPTYPDRPIGHSEYSDP